MVRPMADDQIEQGELTERFRAFAETVDPAPSRSLPVALIIVGAVVVLALVVAGAFLLTLVEPAHLQTPLNFKVIMPLGPLCGPGRRRGRYHGIPGRAWESGPNTATNGARATVKTGLEPPPVWVAAGLTQHGGAACATGLGFDLRTTPA